MAPPAGKSMHLGLSYRTRTHPPHPLSFHTHPTHPCQLRDLLAAELFESAEILGGLVLSRSRAHSPDGSGPNSASTSQRQAPPPSLGSHAESLELYGDALMGRGESRRALVRGGGNLD